MARKTLNAGVAPIREAHGEKLESPDRLAIRLKQHSLGPDFG